MKLIINYLDRKDIQSTRPQLVDAFDIKLSSTSDNYLLLYKYIDREGKEKTSWAPIEFDTKTRKFYNISRHFSEYEGYLPQEMSETEKAKVMNDLAAQGTIDPAAYQRIKREPLPVYFSEKGTLYVKKSDIEQLDWRPLSYEDSDYEYCELLGYELATVKRRYNLKTTILPLISKEEKKSVEEDEKKRRKNEILVGLFPENELYPLAVLYDVEGYGDPMPYARLAQETKEKIRTATSRSDSFLVGARKEEFTPELIMEYLRVLDKGKDKLDADLSLICNHVKREYSGTEVEKISAVAAVFNEYCSGYEILGNRQVRQ